MKEMSELGRVCCAGYYGRVPLALTDLARDQWDGAAKAVVEALMATKLPISEPAIPPGYSGVAASPVPDLAGARCDRCVYWSPLHGEVLGECRVKPPDDGWFCTTGPDVWCGLFQRGDR